MWRRMGMVVVAMVGLGWGCASPSNGVKAGSEQSTPKGMGGQGGAAMADGGQDARSSGGGGAGGAAAGDPGFGGFPGGEMPSCSVLETQYADTVAGAQSCDVGGSGQCQQLVASTLSVCPTCMTYVNDAASANMIRSDWMQLGCPGQSTQPCPQITCPQPTGGHCVAGSGGGTCAAN